MIYEYVKPTGILTLSLLAATVCIGLLRRRKPRLLLKAHKTLGVCALISGLTHGLIVFLSGW